jgi:hypothetical protein
MCYTQVVALPIVKLPNVEPRLQARYRILVKQHLSPAQSTAAGLREIPRVGNGMNAAQAAWRFYLNPRASLQELAHPLLDHARQAVADQCASYVLVPTDWSPLHYTHHESKQDRITLYNKNDFGYLLHEALAISDIDGAPLAPLYLGVEAADGLHCPTSASPLEVGHNLDHAIQILKEVSELGLAKAPVFIFDREGDSLWHLRQFAAGDHLFIVRGNDVRRVLHQGQSQLLEEVESLMADQFQFTRKVDYKGRKASQFIAETEVTLDQPARRQRRDQTGRVGYEMRKGEPLTLRYVLAQVRSEQGVVLATWRLWTNLPVEIPMAQIALWYYWRWRVESAFKLMKSAGQQIEKWQQETAQAVAKRLLIATQACVIVWALQTKTEDERITGLRRVLIGLSGRLMRRGVEYTAPALFAGLWNLLAILDALERYSLSELKNAGEFLRQMLGADDGEAVFKELV